MFLCVGWVDAHRTANWTFIRQALGLMRECVAMTWELIIYYINDWHLPDNLTFTEPEL